MIEIIDEFEISISGKKCPVEFSCAFGPWPPECYCNINDLKSEIGSNLPDRIVIVADLKQAGRKIPFDYVSIEKESDSNKIVLTYEIDINNSDRAKIFTEFEAQFKNSGKIIDNIFFPCWFSEYEPVLISKKDSNENIYRSVLNDVELMGAMKKSKKWPLFNMTDRIINMRIFSNAKTR